MADQDNLRIHQLDDKSDYVIGRIRDTAAISARKLSDAMSDMTIEAGRNPYEEHQQKETNIIVATLSDQALRVVRTVIINRKEMFQKLNKRYD